MIETVITVKELEPETLSIVPTENMNTTDVPIRDDVRRVWANVLAIQLKRNVELTRKEP